MTRIRRFLSFIPLYQMITPPPQVEKSRPSLYTPPNYFHKKRIPQKFTNYILFFLLFMLYWNKMVVIKINNKQKDCKHQWVKVDKDDKFVKNGKYEIKRVKEECIKCGLEKIRRVKRRYK